MQSYHNLLYREDEREMIPYCKAAGVGLMPWSPLARGVLSRPWNRRTDRESSDKYLDMLVKSRATGTDKAIIERVEEVAAKAGASMACIATAWSTSKGCCPIIGMSSEARIEEAIVNASYVLSDEDCKYLEECYLPKPLEPF